MATTHAPGAPAVRDGELISTNPATGAEVGRFPVADAAAVAATVERAREAGRWWAGLGFTQRRRYLTRWSAVLARRITELAEVMYAETGKPIADGTVEAIVALDHAHWAARNARRVLRLRRRRGSILAPEYAAYLEYQPYGVVGVIGPWNYPALTPVGSIGYALAAGNAVVFKPSEYAPAVGAWLADSFASVVDGPPVFQVVHGLADTGAALCRSGVDKVAFTGSTATGKKVMAACAESLTPVLVECGGKDAMIVDEDADLDAAARACVFGGFTNAGQACVGIERVYVVDVVYQAFLDRITEKAAKLTVGLDGADLGPITMPDQVEVIRRHIDDALRRGGRAVLGGSDAVHPPYVRPTILVDVPEDSAAVREETFGPTLTVTRVSDVDEAVARANASGYGLGGAVFGRRRAMDVARRLRSGMTSVNSALAFAGMPSLPFGGVGDSGFGRIHGDDGLREFARAKAIAKRRIPSPLPSATFERTPRDIARMVAAVRLLRGRAGR